MTARRCVFSDLAETDLADIALHIATRNPAAARRLVADARNLCIALVDYPQRYRLREEYGAGVRVAVLGRYLIFYAVRSETVTIERVLHGARHLDWVHL